MRRIFVFFVLLSVSLALASAQDKAKGEKKGGGDVAQTITGLENEWAKNSKAANGDAIAPLLADNIVILDSDGTTYGKSELVDRAKKAKWQTNELSDIKVTEHGNTAVATGVWTGKGTDGKGKAIDTKERWADTWMKTPSGKWQCVATTGVTMPK